MDSISRSDGGVDVVGAASKHAETAKRHSKKAAEIAKEQVTSAAIIAREAATSGAYTWPIQVSTHALLKHDISQSIPGTICILHTSNSHQTYITSYSFCYSPHHLHYDFPLHLHLLPDSGSHGLL